MGGGSCQASCEFGSQHGILAGSFSHIFLVKIVLMFKTTENKHNSEVGDGDGPLKSVNF